MSRRHPNRPLSVRSPRVQVEPDVSEVHKRAVERALRWAWQRVRQRWPKVQHQGSEEEITAKLHFVLNEHLADDSRAAPGLHSFETVGRGNKVESNDGRIELMPDLVFRPPVPRGVRNRTRWGYFVECKIVDGGRSVGLYCTEGIARFAEGAYSAWMASGGLLAYVRDESLPYPTLKNRLQEMNSTLSHARRGADCSVSAHRRDQLSLPCVDIVLSHLWLRVRP